jgi:hypothetical protein
MADDLLALMWCAFGAGLLALSLARRVRRLA